MKSSLLVVAIALLVGSCATGPRPQQINGLGADTSLKQQKIEPEARSTFLPAEQAFVAKSFDDAVRGYRNVKSKFHARTRAHLLASYRLGTIHYYRGEYQEAAREFEYFLTRYPQSDIAFDVTYNLAATHYQLSNYPVAHHLLQKLRPSDIQAQGPRRAEIIYQLWALNAGAMGNHGAAVYAYASQLQLPLEDSVRNQIEEKVQSHLSQMRNVAELEGLHTDITEPNSRQYIKNRLAVLSTAPAEAPATQTSGSELASVAPATSMSDEAGGPVGLPLRASSQAERYNIGVLLPLTGRYAAYGKQALDGIMLGSKIFQTSRLADFRLFIEDTASNPITAEEAAERLVEKYQVSAIIGPLNWREAQAVAERSQALGVLNVTLAAKEGIAGYGAYLYQNAFTPRVQMENLASYAVADRQFKRFAVLYPNNNYGRDMANEFWTAVERAGGKVVSFQSFEPDEKDFQGQIAQLVGVANPKFRRLETTKLAEYVKEQKTKTKKEPKVQLPPIIDFDAIFIPDSPKTVAQIAASLAYYDVKGVPLLGTTEWNSDQLYKRGGRMVEGSIFPGGLSNISKNEMQREFMRSFAEAYGNAPDLLAAQSYEAMQLVANAVQRSGSGSRNDIVVALGSLRDFTTPLGTLSFDSSRIAKRRLPIYTLDNGGQIVEK